MNTVAIEASLPCGSCDATVALNAAVTRVRCERCGRIARVPRDVWTLVLGEASEAATCSSPHADHTADVETRLGIVHLVLRREYARCAVCEARLDTGAGNLTCPECGEAVSRRAPPVKVAGVEALLGEDAVQLAEAKSPHVVRESVSLNCPQCGGGVEADGSERVVPCRFCENRVVLSDAVWHRLHPGAAVRPWYAVCAAPATEARRVAFTLVNHACTGPDGTVYCVGERTYETADEEHEDLAVWAMGPRAELRWARRLCEPGSQEASGYEAGGVFRLPDGRVGVWARGEPAARLFDGESGRTMGTLGGQEPEDARSHHLDFSGFDGATPMKDGGLVALFFGRVLRYDADGNGCTTWPPRSGLFGFFSRLQRKRPLFRKRPRDPQNPTSRDVYGCSTKSASGPGNRPRFFNASFTPSFVASARDGGLYLLTTFQVTQKNARLTRYAPSGKRLWSADLGFQTLGFGIDSPPAVDGDGFAYVLFRDVLPQRAGVIRVSPDGEDVRRIVDRALRDLITSKLAAGPNGEVHVFGICKQNVYSRDGNPVWRYEVES